MAIPTHEQGNGRAAPASDAAAGAAPPGTPIPPLNVYGLVVRKADLVAALRIYVPALGDLQALDGERFLLVLGDADPGD